MFNNAGLATMREITAPEVLKGSLGRNLFSALMRLDCAGAVEFFTYPEYLQVNNIKGCKSFAPGMKVRTVQGADILRNPAAAVSAIRAACDKSKPIDIETRDGPVLSLLCGPADLSILPTEFQPIRVETKGLQNFLDRGL